MHPECNVAHVLERMWETILTQSPTLQYDSCKERLTHTAKLLTRLPPKKNVSNCAIRLSLTRSLFLLLPADSYIEYKDQS